MEKYKKGIVLTLAITIAAMLCLQASAVNVVNNTRSTTDASMSMLFAADQAEKVDYELNRLGEATSNPATLQGNILISTDSDADDYLPAISKDPAGNLAIVWSHAASTLESDVGLARSSDNGETWEGFLFEVEGYQWYADVAYFDGTQYEGPEWSGLWIESLDRVTEGGLFVLIPDLTDDATWEVYGWTEGTRPGATCLNFEDNMWYWEVTFDVTGPVVAMINDDQGMNQGLELWWMAGGEDLGNIVYNWDSGTGPYGDYFPSRDVDTAPIHDGDPAWTEDDFFYTVLQSDVQEKSMLAYKKCIPVVEDDIEFVEDSYLLDGGDDAGYDAAHPEVDASGDRVAIVYMTNDNVYGDWDIRCMYSSDRGETWETSMVAEEGQVDELYPAMYMSGSNVYCAYIKNGNLFTVASEDGGATWGEPTQVNEEDGTVVEEENAVDFKPAGLVWTDNRDGDKDVYFAGGAGGAQLNVVSISGGVGVSAVIENSGTADATGVSWSIDVTGGLVLVGGHTEDTIDIPAGDSVTVSTGPVIGFGGVNIAVNADGASKTASGTLLLLFLIGVS